MPSAGRFLRRLVTKLRLRRGLVRIDVGLVSGEGPLGIRANAILAGAIRTDRWDNLTDEEVAARRARWPAGKESTPDDIAAAVAFLCSDGAGTITGAEIPVDSGIGICLLQYNKDWMKNDEYNKKYWEAK